MCKKTHLKLTMQNLAVLTNNNWFADSRVKTLHKCILAVLKKMYKTQIINQKNENAGNRTVQISC